MHSRQPGEFGIGYTALASQLLMHQTHAAQALLDTLFVQVDVDLVSCRQVEA